MKRLLPFLVIALAVSASGEPYNLDPFSSVPVLVPIGPSQAIDGYGARWSVALIGYNAAPTDIAVPCDQQTCPHFRAGEAFSATGALGASSEPIVLRIPGDHAADLALEEHVTATNSPSRSLRLPVVRLDAITERSITFLDVDSDQSDTRTSFRVYSPIWGEGDRVVTMTIYREYEGRSSAIYSQSFTLKTIVTNGIRIGYAALSFPDSVGRTAFPTRVTFESDAPIWGFVTTSERSDEPAVSLTLPTAK
jgi:hypothetical protein